MFHTRKLIREIPLIILLAVFPVRSQDSAEVTSMPHPTWLWGAAQLVPGPQWITMDHGSRFGLRWQATPLLYSFGLNRRVSPWRFLVAEPLARQNGSVEIFISPEFFDIDPDHGQKWSLRTGLRGYFPIYRYGEYVSGSLAASLSTLQENSGISYEAGIYFFFGIIGFQTTYSPEADPGKWIFTIRLRYF